MKKNPTFKEFQTRAAVSRWAKLTPEQRTKATLPALKARLAKQKAAKK